MSYGTSFANGRQPTKEMDLPSGFHSIRDILDEIGPAEGSMINLVGMVQDLRLPVPTNGTDYKCTLTLSDLSTQDSGDGIILNIFRPENEMPEVRNKDIVMLFKVKIQRFRGSSRSLISNFGTSLYVYAAAKIPRPPRSATVALQPSRKARKQEPKPRETEYVSYLYHQIDKDNAPDDVEFQARAQASLNVKNKFSLLQDVREDKFYDVIAQVARDPYDVGDKITLYVSDYTENKLFFHYTYDGIQELAGGGSFGYSQSSPASKQWHGPYGKRAIQITIYEPHASFVRSAVQATQWLLINNLQVKFGHNAMNLEGYLREDRGATASKLNIAILDTQGDPDHIDPRLKQAVRRLRDYKKQYKDEVRKLEQATGAKRKAEDEVDTEDSSKAKKPNSKTRRKLKRQEAQRKVAEEESRKAAELNKQVVCESQGDAVSAISRILEPSFYDTTLNGECMKLNLPFTCAKYLANVRVVNFHPNALQDFSVSRKISDFDMLSDNSDQSSEEDEEDQDDSLGGGSSSQRVWEWRFCLQLEDAHPQKENPRAQPKRLWVVVDNAAGQCLTGLDAGDLRSGGEILDTLRERMFTLWGDLEELKARDLERARSEKKHKPGDRPALDSDDEEESVKGEEAVSNTPFACCIQQYGVRVPEGDSGKADAGNGLRWERVFGLFGTKISL